MFRSLALHDIHQVPGILVQLQFQLILFVYLELASGVKDACMFLLILTDDNFHS